MINKKQLEAFDAIMRTGSTTQAAVRLAKTQPQVSRLLKTLEDEIGQPLFHRRAHGLEPTATAIEYHVTVSAALQHMSKCVSHGRALARRGPAPIRVLTTPHLARTVIVDTIADFGPTLSRRMEIVFESSDDDWDVALTIEGLACGEVGSTTVARVPVCAVMAIDHKLSGVGSVRWEDLPRENVICVSSHSSVRRELDHRLPQDLNLAKHRISVPNSDLACMLARRGIGIAITDVIHGGDMQDVVMKILDLDAHVPYQIAVRTECSTLKPLVSGLERTIADKCAAALLRAKTTGPLGHRFDHAAKSAAAKESGLH